MWQKWIEGNNRWTAVRGEEQVYKVVPVARTEQISTTELWLNCDIFRQRSRNRNTSTDMDLLIIDLNTNWGLSFEWDYLHLTKKSWVKVVQLHEHTLSRTWHMVYVIMHVEYYKSLGVSRIKQTATIVKLQQQCRSYRSHHNNN